MPYTTEERSKIAEEKSRDAHGHFVSKNTPPQSTIKTDVKVETPFSSKKDDGIDEPLVSFSIQNPFKKILHWLNDIRKHQTTSFSFKMKVPLLALPIFIGLLGGAFQLFFSLGKHAEKQEIAALPTPTPIVIVQPTATPAPVLVSRLGTIKATYQVEYLLSPSPLPSSTVILSDNEGSQSATPTEIPPTPTPVPTRFVLVKGEDITFLIVPSEVNLSYYLNRKVLITGLYDKMTDTLKISKSSDIEILP